MGERIWQRKLEAIPGVGMDGGGGSRTWSHGGTKEEGVPPVHLERRWEAGGEDAARLQQPSPACSHARARLQPPQPAHACNHHRRMQLPPPLDPPGQESVLHRAACLMLLAVAAKAAVAMPCGGALGAKVDRVSNPILHEPKKPIIALFPKRPHKRAQNHLKPHRNRFVQPVRPLFLVLDWLNGSIVYKSD
jgi:hypothetical protein